MSTAALTSLRDYLTGTLSSADMIWLIEEMKDFTKSPEERLKPMTMEEINARLDQAERDFEAGRGIPHEEVMREWEEELQREEQLELEMNEAV